MDDMTGGRSAPKPKKRPNRFVRFLAFLVTLALKMCIRDRNDYIGRTPRGVRGLKSRKS